MPDWLPWPELSAYPAQIWAVPATVLVLVVTVMALSVRRRQRGQTTLVASSQESQPRREGRVLETLLTVAAAGIATAVAVSGMWQVFGDALGFHGASRITLCAFLEIALMVSAIRARRSLRDTGTVGVDGAAVWAIALLSAVLAASDAENLLGRAVRFSAPLVAAWLWERGMAPERRQRRAAGGDVEEQPARRRIAWRWTRERLAVALRLADPVARSTTEVDRARRLATLTQARIRLAVLEAEHPWWIRLLLLHPVRAQVARARLQRQALAAVEHLRLGTDPAVTRQIRTTVAAVVGLAQATSPDNVHNASPWELDGVQDGEGGEGLVEAAQQRRQALEEELAQVEAQRRQALEKELARVELERRRELDEELAQVELDRRRAREEEQARAEEARRLQRETDAAGEQRRQALEEELAQVEAQRRQALEKELARVELERRRELDEQLARIEQDRRRLQEQAEAQARVQAELLQAQVEARGRAEQEAHVQAEQAARTRAEQGRETRDRVTAAPPAPRRPSGRPVLDAPIGVSDRDWSMVMSWYAGQRKAGCAAPPAGVPEQVWAWYLSELQAQQPVAAERVWAEVWDRPRASAGRWRRLCLDAPVELAESARLELVAAASA